RPAGSMTLDRLYWWEHNCPNGQYSPVKVFRTLQFSPMDVPPYYKAELLNLPGLEPEVIEGW
ncbi:type I-C CRISPR-associated protein Cas7/Csd2, partial [[Clostridium] symbiosum]|nr:type I-C CRISPR-associated protein Cas7/Csd2 [[Clostridium] symbiosum]